MVNSSGLNKAEGNKRFLRFSLFIGLFFLLACFILPSSCGDNSNVANLLPPDVQYMADTMFSHRRKALIEEFDSLCASKADDIVRMKVDSLVKLEKARINAMIK